MIFALVIALASPVTAVSSTEPFLSDNAPAAVAISAAATPARIPVGVLFRSDLPGLVQLSDFLYESSTPAEAVHAFDPVVRRTVERWWANPMDTTISREETETTNAVISAYVRENNAKVFQEQIQLFSAFLSVLDPQAHISPLYSDLSNPLGFVTVEDVDTRSIHHIRQYPLISETKALVTPLSLHLNNAYFASRAHELALTRSVRGSGLTIGILDTGVQPRVALDIAGSVDVSSGALVEPSAGACTFSGGFSHGTLVAESATSHHTSLTGPASAARVFDIKIWPTATNGTCEQLNFEKALIDGYAVAVSRALPVVVIASGGDPAASESDGGGDILSRVVNRNARLGVPTYISAGNAGEKPTPWITAPAGAWDAVTVGAAHTGGSRNADDASVAEYTSFGGSPSGSTSPGMGGPLKPDLMAYGSTNANTGLSLPWAQTTYVQVSGTSFSAPFAAGIGAQLMQAFPVAAPYHSLQHRGLLTMGTSIYPLGNADIWRIPYCEACQVGLSGSLRYGYGLVDAIHASQGKTILGTSLPQEFPLAIPSLLQDGNNHRLNMMLVTHAEDSGIDGLEIAIEFTCMTAGGWLEGGGGSVYGQNSAQVGFLLRPGHQDCKIHVYRQNGSTTNVPFVVVVNSEKGWS